MILSPSEKIGPVGRWLDPYAGWAVTALILSILLATLLFLAHVALSFGALLALLIGSLVVVMSGECALCIARVDPIPARPLLAVSIGSVLTSIALVAAVVVTHRTAGEAFLVWGLLVFACAAALRRRVPAQDPFLVADLVAMCAIAVIVAVGCRGAAAAVPTLESTGSLPVWIDYYIHGSVIANFGDPIAVGRGDILVSDVPPMFYHFGFYQLAAAIMSAVDASGLAMATAVLLPLGLFLGAISAYALASEMADRRAGVLALAILVLVPDASHYGLANGFFGFHWLLFTNPGCGYGLAACAAGLTMLVVWFRTGNVRALALAALLIAAVIQLRVHFFIWLAPAALATFLLATPFARRHARTLWSLCLLGLVALIVALVAIEPLQQAWLSNSVVVQYVYVVHAGQEPTAYTGVYARMVEALGEVGASLVGTALIVPAMLGAFVLAYPFALLCAVRARGWHPIDALPLLLLVVFVVVTLFAPAVRWGDVTEYQHRPFVLLYMVIVIWTSVYVVRLLPGAGARPSWVAAGSVGIAAGAIALLAGLGIDPAAARFDWAKNYFNVPINPSLARAAREIRLKAEAGDTVAVGPVAVDVDLVDEATQVTSLTGVPTYLARFKHQIVWDETSRPEAERRLKVLQDVEAATDLGEVVRRLRSQGVTWYVWLGKAGPRFDPERRKAAFADSNVAVYRIGGASSPPS